MNPKVGDTVIANLPNKHYYSKINGKILTIKNVETFGKYVFLTFNEVDDDSIGGGIAKEYFTPASKIRKDRIGKLYKD